MKLIPAPYSDRMGARIRVQDEGVAIAMLEVKVLRQGQQTVREVAEAVVTEVMAQLQRHDQACERLFDMLLQDDGEAFSQAERFLKEHRRDLYDKLGQTKELPK